MSMLAERKQKQKWVLNYNSNKVNDWSKDSNKFGQKMLERMGWKEGKGLGRNEDGLTEHVKVCYKSDSKGIGFKDSVDWSVQQDNFKALLEELSTSDIKHQTPQVRSLEEKSQSSRARVHYQKFTRGKDLTRYSEKDLANIFGRKKLNCDELKEDVVEEKESTITTGIVMIEGGSMVDYFKNKKVDVNKDESGGDHVSYGFGFNGETVKEESKVGKTKKKSKNKENTFISYIDDSNNNNNNDTKQNKIEQTPDRIQKKRKSESLDELNLKKSNKKLKQKDCDLGIVNSAFEPLGNNIVINKHILDTINENDSENEMTEQSKTEKIVDEAPVVHNKKKNKKQKSKGLDNPALSIDAFEPLGNNIVIDKHVLDTINENDSENETIEQSKIEKIVDETPVVNSKKKNKKQKLKGLDNPALNIDESYETTPNNQAVKSKKKKKKPKGVDNPALKLNDSDLNNTSQPESSLTDSSDKSEKKKNKKTKSQGIDNPALTLNDSNIQEDAQNNPDSNHEVKRKKKKKSVDTTVNDPTQSGVENPALDIPNCDLILNVTNEPVAPKPEKVKPKSKQERWSKQPKFNGRDNEGFDARAQHIEEKVNEMTKSINDFQAEVENDINETKAIRGVSHEEFMIGELNCSDGENETHEDGVKLKLKHAKFSRNEPYWATRNDALMTMPKKSYKHLIRGDIIVGFKNSNLHTITGYGVATRH